LALADGDEIALEGRHAGLAPIGDADEGIGFGEFLEHRLCVAVRPVEADTQRAAELGHLGLGLGDELLVGRFRADRAGRRKQENRHGGSEPHTPEPHGCVPFP
jgi:hypothetical protein